MTTRTCCGLKISPRSTKESSSNDTSGLNVAIHTPRDATTLTPAHARPWFCNTLVKALCAYCLHEKRKNNPKMSKKVKYKLQKEIKLEAIL